LIEELEPTEAPAGSEADALRLAAAIRRLIHRTAALDSVPPGLAAEVAALEALADRLEPFTRKGPIRIRTSQNLRSHFERTPIVGVRNPLAPPLTVEIRDGVVRGRVRFGRAHEGPPGYAHGGLVASAFDEILGLAAAAGGSPGVTGTLTVRYRNPTPLDTDLVFEGWLDRAEDRKSHAVGRLLAGDLVMAEAQGVFVRISPEKAARLFAELDDLD